MTWSDYQCAQANRQQNCTVEQQQAAKHLRPGITARNAG